MKILLQLFIISLTDGARFGGSCQIHGPPLPPLPLRAECEDLSIAAEPVEEFKNPVLRNASTFSHSRCPPEIHRSCICVRFIAEHTKMLEDSTKVNSVPIQKFYSSHLDEELKYLRLDRYKVVIPFNPDCRIFDTFL